MRCATASSAVFRWNQSLPWSGHLPCVRPRVARAGCVGCGRLRTLLTGSPWTCAQVADSRRGRHREGPPIRLSSGAVPRRSVATSSSARSCFARASVPPASTIARSRSFRSHSSRGARNAGPHQGSVAGHLRRPRRASSLLDPDVTGSGCDRARHRRGAWRRRPPRAAQPERHDGACDDPDLTQHGEHSARDPRARVTRRSNRRRRRPRIRSCRTPSGRRGTR